MSELTIGMPVFNDAPYLEKSIKSILNQTFVDFQLIISDDGSTDGSENICKKFELKDSRIKYIRQSKNLGISRNMQFLLKMGNSEYFMWAGDDDLYDKTFIEKHINALKKSTAISAFGSFSTIDEKDKIIDTYTGYNYSNPNVIARLKKFIHNSHDAFGYGIFKTKAIKDVEFPIWWWPNKNTPYNNIYPTLCYYLTKGNFAFIESKPLFFKRIKTGANVHHVLTGKNNAIKESFAFWIRRLNLVLFSFKMIIKASNILIGFSVFFDLIFFWFILPSYKQFSLALNSFIKNQIRLK